MLIRGARHTACQDQAQDGGLAGKAPLDCHELPSKAGLMLVVHAPFMLMNRRQGLHQRFLVQPELAKVLEPDRFRL
jgi:hypothetical protein